MKFFSSNSQLKSSLSENIFDNLPSLNKPQAAVLQSEIEKYLSTEPVVVTDPLLWWVEQKHVYPRLSRMARDYLSIPGMFYY
jgi:hypothetical protein